MAAKSRSPLLPAATLEATFFSSLLFLRPPAEKCHRAGFLSPRGNATRFFFFLSISLRETRRSRPSRGWRPLFFFAPVGRPLHLRQRPQMFALAASRRRKRFFINMRSCSPFLVFLIRLSKRAIFFTSHSSSFAIRKTLFLPDFFHSEVGKQV